LDILLVQTTSRKTIKRYYEVFKFSHPTPNDFKRIAEKVSGMQLEWYLNDWVRTTNTIDYGIQQVEEKGQKTKITLERYWESTDAC
jgi:aminopeptidase N